MRDWKNADDDERVGCPAMKFLGCAEKEMQIGFQKLSHVFLADFRQRHPFVAVGGSAAIPKQLAGFPIQDPHFASSAVGVLKAVGKLERQLGQGKAQKAIHKGGNHIGIFPGNRLFQRWTARGRPYPLISTKCPIRRVKPR